MPGEIFGRADAGLPRAERTPGRFVIALALKNDDEARLCVIRRARPIRCGRAEARMDLDGQGQASVSVNEAVFRFDLSEMELSPEIRLAYSRAAAEGAWERLGKTLEAWVILWNEQQDEGGESLRPAARYNRCVLVPYGQSAELHLIRPGRSGWFSGNDVQKVRDEFEEDT